MQIPTSTKKLTRCAYRGMTRYGIDGVKLERRGDNCTATATDGKKLLSLTWKDSSESKPFDAVIDRANWDNAHKAACKTSTIHADESNGRCMLTARTKAGDGFQVPGIPNPDDMPVFPQWRDVVPALDVTNPRRFAVDPKLLRELLESIEATGAQVVIFQPDENPCNAIRIDGFLKPDKPNGGYMKPDIESVGAIMPCRLC